jgi:hypothetical protein
VIADPQKGIALAGIMALYIFAAEMAKKVFYAKVKF